MHEQAGQGFFIQGAQPHAKEQLGKTRGTIDAALCSSKQPWTEKQMRDLQSDTASKQNPFVIAY